jgi:tetratricopeptide (TPR) repeat protein
LQRFNDWLRREIKAALDSKRNIVPLMLEGFDFGSPAIASQLTGKLAKLKQYNALNIPADYFMEAMGRLRDKYLSVPLKAVLHPASRSAARAADEEKGAARLAPPVPGQELTTQQWFERGFNTRDLDEKLRFYSHAIRLKPDYADAFYNRGRAYHDKNDLKAAIRDYGKAIRLQPDFANAFNNRGCARYYLGDLEGALQDYNKTVRLEPNDGIALSNRAEARRDQGDLKGALQDCNRAIRFKPDHAEAFFIRGSIRRAKGNLDGAIGDYNEAIHLQPDYAEAVKRRDAVLSAKAAAGPRGKTKVRARADRSRT